MAKHSFDHDLDLYTVDGALELFADEVSGSEMMQLCCDGSLGTLSSASSATGCVGCVSTVSSISSECCGS